MGSGAAHSAVVPEGDPGGSLSESRESEGWSMR